MSIYRESGIKIDLRGKPHHRFEELETYQTLKGQSIKEVDFCWLQHENHIALKENSLICLELKGYERDRQLPIDLLLVSLEKKIRDTLSMFTVAWLNRGQGSRLKTELPDEYCDYQDARLIKIIVLIQANNSQASALQSLRTKLKNKLRGVEQLYAITITVTNIETAIKMGLPVDVDASE